MTRLRWTLSFFVLALSLPALAVQAATYHVSPSGNDSAACSQAQQAASPRRTINGGIACLASGDTLVVAPGTYEEHITDVPGHGGYGHVPPPGKSWAQPTTLRCQATHACTLRIPPHETSTVSVMEFGQSYDHFLSIEGFVLDAQSPGKRVGYGVGFGDPRTLRFKDVQILYPQSQGFQGAGCGGCQFVNVDIVGVATDPQTGANLCRACDDGTMGAGGACAGECHGYYLCHTGANTSGLLWEGGSITGAFGYGLQNYCRESVIRNMCISGTVAPALLIGGGHTVSGNRGKNQKDLQVSEYSKGNAISGNTFTTGAGSDCTSGVSSRGGRTTTSVAPLPHSSTSSTSPVPPGTTPPEAPRNLLVYPVP